MQQASESGPKIYGPRTQHFTYSNNNKTILSSQGRKSTVPARIISFTLATITRYSNETSCYVLPLVHNGATNT